MFDKKIILKFIIFFSAIALAYFGFSFAEKAHAADTIITWPSFTIGGSGGTRISTTTLPGTIYEVNWPSASVHGQCSNGSQIQYRVQLRQTQTGAVIATSEGYEGVQCSNMGVTNDVTWTFADPIHVHGNYGITIDAQVNPSSPGCTLGPCNGISFNSNGDMYGGGDAGVLADLEWNAPTDGQILDGWPSHLNFNVDASQAFCGYVTAIVNGVQGGTEGSCFPAGSTEYNYFTPGTPATGTIQANIKITPGEGSHLLATSTISFTSLTTAVIETGEGIGPTFPVQDDADSPTSNFFVDCSEYDFWDTIDVFGAGAIPWPNVGDWFPGMACLAKKTTLGIASALFVPERETMEEFSDLTLEEKFPFAYFYDMKSAFEDQNASSTNEFPAAVITMPSLAAGGDPHDLVVFSSSTISSLVGNDKVALFRTLMQAIIWVGLGYALYRKAQGIFHHA